MEEPPTKVTKFEMESQFLESDVMEEGQEEWLSEGILTDDDFNPGSQELHPGNDSNFATSQDGDQTMRTISTDDSQVHDKDTSKTEDSNIEETLNNFENSQSNSMSQEIPTELSAFLTRKSDQPTEPAVESELDEPKPTQEDDDGNDTDDLLRVLGDGDQKVKLRVKKDTNGDSSDDDDGYIFEGKKVQNYEIAKKALMRATASKAVPEDDDVTDCSSDEAPLSKILTKPVVPQPYNRARQTNIKISTDVKPGNLTITPPAAPASRNIVKKVINVTHAPVKVKKQTTPVKQYANKRLAQEASVKTPAKQAVKRPEGNTKPTAEEIINEKDFFEDDDVDLDEDFAQKSTQASKTSQRIMRPEEMDEDVPTDNDSSDEESLYDELPTSDSDQGLDDWFTLDIRAERAGDYLPLLGDRAFQLLLEEKRRVAGRLETLKKSLSALSETGREQAEKLKEATSTAAELDAMLRAN